MKSNRKKAYSPVKPEGNEGVGAEGRITYSDGECSWEESFNLIEILENALQKHNLASERRNGWLVVNNDLYLRPEFVRFESLEPSGVRTVTSISIAHEKYVPEGLFEYQHASEDDMNSALTAGINNWIEIDLPVILDAVRNSLETCSAMDLDFPEPARRIRRALLGPVLHLASRDIEIEEEHSFCPCCLLTNSFEAFRQQLDGEGIYGIRLLVLRDEDGELSADCRVNGIDWELGREHLKKYGETWTGRGFEMRKQYVVIYTMDADEA
jgi:hypothetical protein